MHLLQFNERVYLCLRVHIHTVASKRACATRMCPEVDISNAYHSSYHISSVLKTF